MNIRVKSLMIALAMVTTVWGQEEPKLTVKPSGRILFDAAYINPQHQENQLKSGVGSPDMLKWCPAPPDTIGAAFAYDIMQYMWGKQMCLARQEFRIKAGLATIIEMKAYQKAMKKSRKVKR